MIEFAVLASGSKGNCTYVKAGEYSFLIDSGLSCKQTEIRMKELGINPESISGVFVTHEHSDHIKSVHTISFKYKVPIYSTKGTFNGGNLSEKRFYEFIEISSGKPFNPEKGIEIFPCPVSHDAADPVCFVITFNGIKFSSITDLGYKTELISQTCKNSHGLVVEFNHDPEMLKISNYPWPLKQRILSRSGHLSNNAAAELTNELCEDYTKHVVLAHLSEDNNHPDIALMTLKHKLNGYCAKLTVAKQATSTEVFKLTNS